MAVSRRGLLQVAAGLGMAGAAGASELPAGPSRAWSATPDTVHAAKLERLRAYVEEHRRAYGLPGLTLSVVAPGGYTGLITSGWSNVDRREPVRAGDLFQIGSISKSMTGLCIFRAVQDGKLKLSDDIRDVLPGVMIDGDERVTLQHLVNHSSGLPDDPPTFPRATNNRLWLGYKPGSRWSYSNTGYGMLGLALERAYGGELFERIVERDVLRPLGMNTAHGAIRQEERPAYATGYSLYQRALAYPRAGRLAEAQWLDVTFSAGSIAATGADMARYLEWLIGAGNGRGGPVLSDAFARQWTSPTVDAPGWAKGAKYANGLAVVKVGDRTMLHHTGGMVAFSSSLHVDPEAGVGCFASTNMGLSGYRPRDITAFACELFGAKAGAKAPQPQPKSTAMVVEKAGDFAGRFTDRSGLVLETRAVGKGLTLSWPGGEVTLEPSAENAFIAAHPTFNHNPFFFEMQGGKVVAIWYGEREFARDPACLRGPAPAELQAVAGRYDNDDPWAGVMRVVARPTGLFMDGVTKMTPLPDGSWRIGDDDWSPERVWFDAPLSGKTQRMSLSGLDFLRRPDRV